jgi:hypothetical protein
MNFVNTKVRVFNRGVPPDAFLAEQVAWGRQAADDMFAPNANYDIYNKVFNELGPWEGPLHRKAVMLEVERVLAGFESSWDHTEGVDTSRLGIDTPENAEAGAWQVSYGSRYYGPILANLLESKHVTNGMLFQRVMKFDHWFSMEYVARMLRTPNGCKENGPLYKGDERLAIRKSLRAAEQSIYPWLSRASVKEFESLLA